MVHKVNFVNKCSVILSHFFTERGTKATIDVMERLKLNNLNGHDEVPDDQAKACIDALYERVKMLKGDDTAKKFLKEIRS